MTTRIANNVAKAPETPTPASRYPSNLSKRSSKAALASNDALANIPSRGPQKGQAKGKGKQNSKPLRSNRSLGIMNEHQPRAARPPPRHPVHPPPNNAPVIRIKELSSLQELLQQAGYKETRVFTPEAEKVRKIKKTLDDADEGEVNELYGTYGLVRPNGSENQSRLVPNEHRITNITEPTLPLTSSSSILRSVAMQDQAAKETERIAQGTGPGLGISPSDSTWWGGSVAAIGRAAKAVIDMSPPTRGTELLGGTSSKPSPGIGLGLSGADSLRKVKSNWELERTDWARDISPSWDKEQRPPSPIQDENPSPPASERHTGIILNAEPPPNIASIFSPPLPPRAVDDDAYGYSPLPEDYEEQCDEDDALFNMTGYDISSLGSSRLSSEERDQQEAQGVDSVLQIADSIDLDTSEISASSIDLGLKERIMMGAVEYDGEFDTPPKSVISLPTVDAYPMEDEARSERIIYDSVSALDTTRSDLGLSTTAADAIDAPAKPLKYADRATKLRMARSTPALSQIAPTEDSWFGSIRQAVRGVTPKPSGYEAIPAVPAASSSSSSSTHAPLRPSPAVLAAPTLITTAPVVCDSSSIAAADLPPIRMKSRTPTGPISTLSLRLRPSLARIRSAIGLPADSPSSFSDDDALTLSPRLDWDKQGEQYAGWNWTAKKRNPIPFDAAPTPQKAKGSIDYTKSFFYKPTTPPHPSAVPTIQVTEPETPKVAENGSANGQLRNKRSIKSLRAALLLPVAPPPPPVPTIPAQFVTSSSGSGKLISGSTTPPLQASTLRMQPPVLAISSPGAHEAGRPPRALVLEGEEWDARDGVVPGDWGKKALRKKTSGKRLKKKGSRKSVTVPEHDDVF